MVTWGDPLRGGDSSKAAAAITAQGGATKIFSTDYAFAAITKTGKIVWWVTACVAVHARACVPRLRFSGFAAIRCQVSLG